MDTPDIQFLLFQFYVHSCHFQKSEESAQNIVFISAVGRSIVEFPSYVIEQKSFQVTTHSTTMRAQTTGFVTAEL